MPTENSSTRTPQALAVMKWPNSWLAIRMPKTKMPMRIYT